jgi:hypothetical protein
LKPRWNADLREHPSSADGEVRPPLLAEMSRPRVAAQWLRTVRRSIQHRDDSRDHLGWYRVRIAV